MTNLLSDAKFRLKHATDDAPRVPGSGSDEAPRRTANEIYDQVDSLAQDVADVRRDLTETRNELTEARRDLLAILYAVDPTGVHRDAAAAVPLSFAERRQASSSLLGRPPFADSAPE